MLLLLPYAEMSYLALGILDQTTVNFFKKNLLPSELGAHIYESLRRALQSDSDLSMQRLLASLELVPEELHSQHVGEVMIGLMFGATLAIESAATPRTANQIVSALKAEFLNHLEEQGATALQRAEWEAVLAGRFLSYRATLEGYTGFEPPWKLGRALFWNIIDSEVHIAMCVKICTLYMMAARDMCLAILKEYGPRLHMQPQP